MESWNEITPQFNSPIVLIDLPGHGQSYFKDIDDYSFREWVGDFKFILGQLEIKRINLCGYSMGGRLALFFACKYSKMVNRLILEGATAGIIDETEREKRIGEDLLYMTKINKDYLDFIKKWSDNLLFKNQIERNSSGWEAQQEIRRDQNEAQISLSLEFLGNGKMPSLWDKINKIQSSVMLITGSEDSKYCRIATECLQEIPDCKWVNISNCGHNVHLEQSTQFVEAIKSFLQS
jgi:2-succinyl-6-hydroxy-2,4-cyclohexadiene-1-carboxylate synthase